MKGRALSLEIPTQWHRTILAAINPGDFQDRCLKPLGHPSKPLLSFSYFLFIITY